MQSDTIPKGPLVALLAVVTASCGLGREGGGYRAFSTSHDAIRPGMSIRDVFEAGLADYLIALGGTNVPGVTLPEKQPVSPECRRHVFDVHYGSGDLTTAGGFSIHVYCDMNGSTDKQLAPEGSFKTKRDLLQGLDTYSSWTKSMTFSVRSPPLQIGGVYDSYDFSVDENGKVAAVSVIRKSGNDP